MNVRNELREHLQRLLAQKGDQEPLGDADSLVLSGRLDSVDILHTVVFLESNYGIDFADKTFDQEDFDSIDRILALIELRAPAAGTR
jgi:acyl carrier protein